MKKASFFCAALCAALFGLGVSAARADDSGSAPPPYDKFVANLTAQHGLFTIWRGKDGAVYLDLAANQLGKDYIASGQPINGVSGNSGISQGNYYFLPARLIRFERQDNKIAIIWPNTNFAAPAGSPEANSVQNSFARSVVSVAKIASEDEKTGHVVFDASAFLDDIVNLTGFLRAPPDADAEMSYHLDKDHSYFGKTKAFPRNVLLEVNQNWTTTKPQLIDTAPDARSLEIRVAYDIAEAPDASQYMPRLTDPRVGYFNQTVLDFSDEQRLHRQLRYVVRWNFKPADPNKAVSDATNPLVFYLSNEIPMQYRDAVRQALLAWNGAFDKAGISNAVQVRDQPNDPEWDPDDIRYSVVRWVSGSYGSGGAEAQLLYDPRTGEEFRTGITIDADLMHESNVEWQYQVNPRRGASSGAASFTQNEAQYAAGARAQAQFGRIALRLFGQFPAGRTPHDFNADFLKSVTLHESGHDMGLQHNFIGSLAYTAKQLQDRSFTQRYGIVNSVMEYTPLNLWPKGSPQGIYFQTLLGPYDYYAIHWGYARVPGARTPQEEVPTLNRWANQWANPWYRFASDEDAGGPDPRAQVFDLSNDPVAWCQTQMNIAQGLFPRLDSHFPWPGEAYDRERDAFTNVLQMYLNCAGMPSRFIGGEYLARSHRGDPAALPPLQFIPRAEVYRAFSTVNKNLFADSAFHFSPATLNRLTYSEFTSLKNASWVYNAQPRKDVPVAEMIAEAQMFALQYMFDPATLERLADNPLQTSPGQTASLTDLFDWTQSAIYGNINSKSLTSVPLLRRNLQQNYARLLIRIATKPEHGTPHDAQSLARAKLVELKDELSSAPSRRLDELTQAHLARLKATISQALDGKVASLP